MFQTKSFDCSKRRYGRSHCQQFYLNDIATRAVSLIIWRKRCAERFKEPSLRRPVCDGKYYVRKRSPEVDLKGMPKVPGRAVGIVPEGTTAPSAKNKY